VNPKIAGKWMFIPLELIIIGFDPPPYIRYFCQIPIEHGDFPLIWLLAMEHG
jgi:hypothetical protein